MPDSASAAHTPQPEEAAHLSGENTEAPKISVKAVAKDLETALATIKKIVSHPSWGGPKGLSSLVENFNETVQSEEHADKINNLSIAYHEVAKAMIRLSPARTLDPRFLIKLVTATALSDRFALGLSALASPAKEHGGTREDSPHVEALQRSLSALVRTNQPSIKTALTKLDEDLLYKDLHPYLCELGEPRQDFGFYDIRLEHVMEEFEAIVQRQPRSSTKEWLERRATQRSVFNNSLEILNGGKV